MTLSLAFETTCFRGRQSLEREPPGEAISSLMELALGSGTPRELGMHLLSLANRIQSAVMTNWMACDLWHAGDKDGATTEWQRADAMVEPTGADPLRVINPGSALLNALAGGFAADFSLGNDILRAAQTTLRAQRRWCHEDEKKRTKEKVEKAVVAEESHAMAA